MARLPVCLSLAVSALVACSNSGSPPPSPLEAPPAAAPPAPPSAPVRLERESTLRESGAMVLVRVEGARRALVADEDDGALVEIDLDKKAVAVATSIGTRPRDLLVLA